MAPKGPDLKSRYQVAIKLEPFFSGGAFAEGPDGSLIACACYDEVKIIDAALGKVQHSLQGDTEPITAVAWSHATGKVFAASRSLQLRCWERETFACLRTWKAHTAAITSLALDTSGAILVSSSADKTLRVWNTEGYYCTHVFRGHKSVALQTLILSQKLQVVSASEDGEIRIWNLNDQKRPKVLPAHDSAVTSLSASSDECTLLSAGRDKVVIVWDLQTHQKQSTIPVFEAVEGAAILPGVLKKGGVYFATAGEKGIVRVWSSRSSTPVAEQLLEGPFEEGSQLTGLALSTSGHLISTSEDAKIQFLDPQKCGLPGIQGTFLSNPPGPAVLLSNVEAHWSTDFAARAGERLAKHIR